jgi:hypothetical protein
MGHFIDKNGWYYEGDKISGKDIAVPKRPDETYRWSGTAWTIDSAIKKEKDQRLIRNQIVDETPYFAMLFIHLIQKLIQKGTITASDFSAADQAEYNKIKTWVDNYLNI